MYLDKELREVFAFQREIMRKNLKVTPYIFPNWQGTDKKSDFRTAWNSACERVKIGNRLFHDLRRTAVRNMVRSGVPERVVMAISGHKTRSVFDRYNIVSDGDLRLAIEKQEAYLKTQNSYKTVTFGNFRTIEDSRRLEGTASACL